jgi:hypothetical protein
MMRLGAWGKTPGVSRRERAQAGEVHPAIAAIVGAKHRTWFGAGINDAEPVSLSRVTHINRGDHRVVDTRSGWLPIPTAVAASEETVTRSSAVHLSRTAQVDRDDRRTLGRTIAPPGARIRLFTVFIPISMLLISSIPRV